MLKNALNELIFGPDMHFNGFYRFFKEFLINFKNCLIFGQKTQKFVKISKSLNGHRMLKNASNELKFGPDMYFNGFYRFFKEFLINFKKLPDLWPNNMPFLDIFLVFCKYLRNGTFSDE